MTRFLSLVFLCIAVQSAMAQQKVRFSQEALSVSLSGGGEFAALTTSDSVFVYRLPEMSLYKKAKHNLVYPTVVGFAAGSFNVPDFNDVLIMQENHLRRSDPAMGLDLWAEMDKYRRSAFGERVKDSLLLWSISKAAVINNKVAGNVHFDFFTFREMGVSAVNIIGSAFEGTGGDSVFIARKASIFSQWNTGQSKQSEINAVVKKMVTCPVNLSFTLVTQEPVTKKYKIVVKKTETHQTIYESNELDQLPLHVGYSSDGQLLVYATNPSFKKSLIEVADISNKKIIVSIPVEDELTNLSFIGYNEAIGYSTGSNWVKWNIAEARVEKEISGTAFFSGFKLLDAIPADKYLFVHTQAMNAGVPLSQSEIQLSPMEDFNVFAEVKKGGTETIALKDEFNMQINDMPDVFFDLYFNPAKTHFTILGNNDKRLQVWETKSRKKILDKYFDNKVDGFVDAGGRYVWIIEYKQGDATRYRLRHIDLQTGRMFSSDQLAASQGSFKNNSNKITAVAIAGEPNAWYVNDGDNILWKFKGDNIVPEKYEFNVPGFVTVRSIIAGDNGLVYASIYNSNKERTIIAVDFAARSYQKIIEGNYGPVFPYKDGLLLETDSGIGFLRKGKIEKTIPVEGKFIRLAVDKKNDRIFIQIIKDNGADVLMAVNATGERSYQKVPERMMGLAVLNNGQVIYIGNGVKTFVDENVAPVPWNASLPKNNNYEDVSVSANGRFILKNHLIVDLKEANRYPTDAFTQSVFVPGKNEMERIELFSKGWSANKYFSIRRISGADTTVSETQVKIPDNILTGYAHSRISLSPDEQWLVSTADLGMDNTKPAVPMLWNARTLKGYFFPESMAENVPFFSSDTGKVFVQSEMKLNESLMTYFFTLNEFNLDADKGPVFVKKTKNIHELALPGEYNFVLPEFTSIDWITPNSSKVKKQFFSAQNMHHFAFNKQHQLLFGGTAEGILNIWDINGSSSPIQSVQVTNDQISSIKIRGDKVFVFSAASNVAVYSIKEKKLLANLQYLQKEGDQKLAMYTPDKYFNMDPEAMDALHFIKQGQVFPLSSYELQGNRPDKVYKALGFAEQSYIETLNKSWQTRLKRVGIKPSESFLQSHGPHVSWNRADLPLMTKDNKFLLNFSAADTTRSPVSKLLIRINGVPLTGRNGITMQPTKDTIAFNKIIELNQGKNLVSVIAINSKGDESIEQTHEIYYLPAQKQPKRLLYIGVGVSEYKDSAKNLVYAAKDVTDIASRIKYYADSVQTFTLTDANASRQKIMELKSLLQKTSTDDVVILSFSGHGMVDSASGFLFAPHDMNFDLPAQKGISMTMIEDLLDDIPARKRLLLVDACHSGELLEGLTANAVLPEGVKEINTKGVDKIQKKADKEKEAERKGYMVMKDVFSDFSRGNGAFMISAAASNEFALESKQWKNGVFTASFLEALYELKEKSNDKTIKVRELRKAIYEKVKQRTKGQQTPTSRQENGWWNWSF